MDSIFELVARTLDGIAALTGRSYEEINVIAYYILLPLVYLALVDRIWRRHWLKLGWVAGWALALARIEDFAGFADAVFAASVRFLNWFAVVGLDYVAASVVICVLLPGVVLLVLLAAAFPKLGRCRSAFKSEPAAVGSARKSP